MRISLISVLLIRHWVGPEALSTILGGDKYDSNLIHDVLMLWCWCFRWKFERVPSSFGWHRHNTSYSGFISIAMIHIDDKIWRNKLMKWDKKIIKLNLELINFNHNYTPSSLTTLIELTTVTASFSSQHSQPSQLAGWFCIFINLSIFSFPYFFVFIYFLIFFVFFVFFIVVLLSLPRSIHHLLGQLIGQF